MSVRSPPPLPSHLFSLSLSLFSLSPPLTAQRAEHNDGVLHSLEELSLNQLGLVDLGFVAAVEQQQRGSASPPPPPFNKERRRHQRRRLLLPRACRKLRHLSLAGNSLPRLPCGPQNLGLCKELRTLNVALNAIESIKNTGRGPGGEGGPLASCESLKRLDLSGNFVSKGTIRETVESLSSAPVLEYLWLSGCPVAVGWGGYRPFVVAGLPRLRELVRVFFSVFFFSLSFFLFRGFFSFERKSIKKTSLRGEKKFFLRTASPLLRSSASSLSKRCRN